MIKLISVMLVSFLTLSASPPDEDIINNLEFYEQIDVVLDDSPFLPIETQSIKEGQALRTKPDPTSHIIKNQQESLLENAR